jgi:hypothetical protein
MVCSIQHGSERRQELSRLRRIDSGGPLQCFVGENVDTRVNGGDTNETKSNPGSSSLLNTWD